MKFTNFQQEHHQFQDYLSTVSSSLASPSLSVADNINDHAWRDDAPTFFLINDNIHATCGEASSPTSFNNSMIQELEFPLPNFQNHQQLPIPGKIKEESSTSSEHSDNSTLQKFTELLSPSNNTCPSEILHLNNNTQSPNYQNQMVQPSPFQSNIQYHDNSTNNHDHLSSLRASKGVTSSFSRIFPSVNISNLSSFTSMDQLSSNNVIEGGSGLGSFATERFVSEPSSSSHLLELFNGTSQCGVHHGSQPLSDEVKLCNISSNLSSFDNNGVLETKRASYIVEPKSTQYTEFSKKQRLESHASSCPPFKVRKEKVGDRVAALQQLVAPFGKTDTASVLMEAIGYIKFLQNQIETLSVPYMNLASRHSGSSNRNQRISNENGEIGDQTQDLRSQGLCVVPVSCLSSIASDPAINGGPWLHPHGFDHGF